MKYNQLLKVHHFYLGNINACFENHSQHSHALTEAVFHYEGIFIVFIVTQYTTYDKNTVRYSLVVVQTNIKRFVGNIHFCVPRALKSGFQKSSVCLVCLTKITLNIYCICSQILTREIILKNFDLLNNTLPRNKDLYKNNVLQPFRSRV